jgi:hypothetical protein
MNISDLLKKIQGVKKGTVEEAFNKAVEDAKGEAKGFDSFVLVTENQTAVCGTGADLLALVSQLLSTMAKDGLPKEGALKAVELAYLSDEELEKRANESMEQNKDKIEKLRKIAEILEEDNDNE